MHPIPHVAQHTFRMPSKWIFNAQRFTKAWFCCVRSIRQLSLAWVVCGLGFFQVCLSLVDDCPSMCFCKSSLQLNCSRQNLTSIPAILHEKDIDQISLSFNHLRILVNYSFQNMGNLKVLHLDYNYIYMVETEAFHGLYNLEILNLQGNLLESLDPGLFQSMSHLESLDLSYNDLKVLDSQLFEGLTRLKHLDLRNNKIVAIRNDTFSLLSQLLELQLAQNPIDDLDPTAFQVFPQLLTMNLSQTGMSSLNSDLLQNLPNLRNLDLSKNLLKNLDPSTVDQLTSMEYFNLSGNPLNCDCKMIPLRNWTGSHVGMSWTAENTAQCSSPVLHSGDPFHTLPLSNFTCDVQLPGRRPSRKKVKVKEKLPYNKMMGWYTAATLSGMLVLFLLCVVLDKLKRRFFRWRRARRDRMEKYKFNEPCSHQNSIRGPRTSIDCMDSISIVVTQSFLDDPPQTTINSVNTNRDTEPKVFSMTSKTNTETADMSTSQDMDSPGVVEKSYTESSMNGPSTSFYPKPWKKYRLSRQEQQQHETSI